MVILIFFTVMLGSNNARLHDWKWFIRSGQMPGSPVSAGEQLAGIGVIEDFFFLHTPADLATREHGDQAEMSGNGAVMRGGDRCDGWFAGQNAIEKIPVVIGGFVEFYLAQFFGQVFAFFPLGIGSIEAFAIHPNPT